MKATAFRLKRELRRISSHLADMLDGALAPLSNKTKRMRFAMAAHGLRELLREVLAHFAPDAKIKNACWFKPDPSSKTGITRKHRTTFAVYGFVNPAALPEALSREVEEIAHKISDHVEHLSEYAHTTAEVLTKPESEAITLLDSTLDLFPALLKAVAHGQETLIDELQMALTRHLSDIFVNDFFDELDILSTHTRPTGADDVQVEISDIDEQGIYFTGTGSVSCDLQYGSDGDCRREDGVEWQDSFPFSFEGAASVTDLETEVERESVNVDTGKYYE